MQSPHALIDRSLARLALATVLALVGLAAYQATAHAQAVADPDFWKQTAEHRNTVNRFVYGQSPQAIPASYDVVREAEAILAQQQRTLPPSNPQAPSLWQRIRTLPVKAALSTPARALGTIGLGTLTFKLGWKIGTGINAKFLRVGIPAENPGNGAYDALPEVIEFKAAGSGLPQTSDTMPEDGWIWRLEAGRYVVERPGSDPCERPLAPPVGYVRNPGTIAMHSCAGPPGGLFAIQHDSYYLPENELGAQGPIEDYADQPVTRSSPAPTPPPQATVEQAIETELDKPENELLRHWLNYQLGSPNETDPTGVGAQLPEIEFPDFVDHWERHHDGFTTPYADPVEYWRDAVDIVTRQPNDPDVLKCERFGDDPADVYFDTDEQAIVIVKDGKIVTYFVPDQPGMTPFEYWLNECG